MVDKTDEEMAGLVDTMDLPIEATTTYKKWQAALEEELGMRYSDILAEASWRGVETKYVALPELGMRMERHVFNAGTIKQYTQISYRDLTTGQFIARPFATEEISSWWRRKEEA